MKKATRTYLIQLSLVLIAYAVCLVVALGVLHDHPHASWRPAIALLPMVPALFVPFVVLQKIRAMDEMQRRIQFEALGFSFAASAVVTFGYGLLENAGLRQLNWTFVWPVMGTFWILGLLLARRRYA